MTDEIVLLKLVSGIDLMGKVLRETDDELVLLDVRALHYQAAGANTNVGFGPFLIAADRDDSTALRKRHIMVRTSAAHQIASAYKQAVSPIQLASAMPRLTQ